MDNKHRFSNMVDVDIFTGFHFSPATIEKETDKETETEMAFGLSKGIFL